MPLSNSPLAEHIAWAKRRAADLLDQGDLHNAFACFVSDINKHAEAEIPPLWIHEGVRLLMNRDAEKLKAHILAFEPSP